MKKFLFWATVVGASLTGCVNDVETVLSSEDNPQPITFEVGKYKPSSRATFPQSQTFGTYAFYENSVVAGHSPFMENVEIGYHVAATPYWGAIDKEYFWPIQGHLDFISYAPYCPNVAKKDDNDDPLTDSAGNIIYEELPNIVPRINNDQTTLTYSQYTVDENEPIDLLYSSKATNQKANTINYGFTGVPTLFHHALSMLSFKVKMQRTDNSDFNNNNNDEITTWEIVLNSITLNHVHTTGSVILYSGDHPSVSASSQVQDWSTNTTYQVWSVDGTVISKTWAPTHGHNLTTTAVEFGLGTDQVATNYYVMPQELHESGQSITINYTLKQKKGNHVGTSQLSSTKSFSLFSVKAWEMGKHITYTIEIDPAGDTINFAPSVEDWVTVEGTVSTGTKSE